MIGERWPRLMILAPELCSPRIEWLKLNESFDTPYEAFRRATSQRLIACSQKLIAAFGGAQIGIRLEDQDAEPSWASFKREVRRAEKALIERALRQGGGSVTKAAHLLGFKHHQSLISIINLRHE